ncbi:MAG: acyl--CoA ligase [Chitinophagaceae bacterium]|nr:acyl--CoA ligase [Chitinophagaceae bacterium]
MKLAAGRFGEKIALTDGTRHLNFKQQYDAVLHLSSVISKSAAINKAKAVAIFACSNSINHIITLFALQNLGLKVILINHKAHIKEIERIRENQFCPCYIFSSEPAHIGLPDAFNPDLLINTPPSGDNKIVASKKHASVIFPTSGTTGNSKLIEKKTGTFYWLRSFAHLVTFTGIYKREAVYISIPVSHGFGYTAFMFAMVLGKKAMITDTKNQQLITQFLISEKVDLVAGVPSSLYQVAENMQNKKHSINLIISGGAPLNEVILKSISQHLTTSIYGMYGSTEASTSFIADYNMLQKNIHALGKPLKGVKYRLQPLSSGGKELLIQSPLANLGSDSWLHSGDLAEYDEDGNLTWCGRKDNMIIKNGINIYPSEIENAMHQLPGFDDVFVKGEDDDAKGEIIVAIVKLKADFLFDEEQTKNQLKKFLPTIKIPDKIVRTESFSYTSTGKKISPVISSSGQ